jgi:hypothetical protein
VVRAGWIARCRTNATIGLAHELVVTEALLGRIAPELAPHTLVHAFGQRLCQAIGQRLEHDRAVIVVACLELAHFLVETDAGGDGERAHPVFQALDAFGATKSARAKCGWPAGFCFCCRNECSRCRTTLLA